MKRVLIVAFFVLFLFSSAYADTSIPSGANGAHYPLAEGIVYNSSISVPEAVEYVFTPAATGEYCFSLRVINPVRNEARNLEIRDQNAELLQRLSAYYESKEEDAVSVSDWIGLKAGIPYTVTIYGSSLSAYRALGEFTVSVCSRTVHADWLKPVVQQYAGCTEDGYSFQTCASCSEVQKVDIIPATGHQPGEWMIEMQPTCGSEGSEFRRCTLCQQRIETRLLECVEHTPDPEWTVVQEPDCVLPGYKAHLCLICGKALDYFELPAIGHQYVNSPGSEVAATCEEDGVATYNCGRCGIVLECITTPSLGHNWNEWTILLEALPYSDGQRSRTCNRCDAYQFEGYAFRLDDGTSFWTCSHCGEGRNFGNFCYVCGTGKPQNVFCGSCGEDLGKGYDKPRCYMCGELLVSVE